MLMNTEEHAGYAEAVQTSSSSTFGSFSASLDENSSLTLPGSTTTTTNSSHQPVVEVSSLQIPLSPIAFDDGHHGLFFGNDLDTVVNLDDHMTQEPHQEQAQSKNAHEFGGAFKKYVQHLSPRKKPNKPGASGQRAIKDAMSALERMHRARLAQWQSLQMDMAAAPPSVGSNSNNQIQHVLSERKRREKLNNSFKALRTVLPPGTKKDRASTLIRARDYVITLESRVSELEEKNRMLVESPLHSDNGSEQDDYSSGEQTEVDITDKTSAEETSQEFRLKIVVGSGRSTMDAVVAILQCAKEIGDLRLVAMDTGSSSGSSGLPHEKDVQLATSSSCDNSLLKESAIKTFKEAMKSRDDSDDLDFYDCSVEM
ncbi:hypothetical protein PR202_gb24622 [Eleusine coracana subsp. coracana]|uniref:BHLH domain-containing protein n=1 Tax=Eleusine coracana subsp. coracana TaxID=191504 RepID=A0AAV5FMW1_ELECO|nr:hypothetical protein PR202_gb24622 [Eleusine coracana subsp. coracana]